MNKIITPHIPLQILAKNYGFLHISKDIACFPSLPNRRYASGFKLFHFENTVLKNDIENTMKEEEYQTANHYELLLWKKWNKKDTVIALGTEVMLAGNFRLLLQLEAINSYPILTTTVSWLNRPWRPENHFLGIPLNP